MYALMIMLLYILLVIRGAPLSISLLLPLCEALHDTHTDTHNYMNRLLYLNAWSAFLMEIQYVFVQVYMHKYDKPQIRIKKIKCLCQY